MGNVLIGYTNYVKMGTVAASSTATNFPATNLQNDSGAPADGWQSYAGTTACSLTFTPAATGQVFRLIGLFRTNLTSAASITFDVFTNPSTLVWSTTVAGPANGSGQVVVDAGNAVGDYAEILITDTGNPDGHINVPLAFAGPAWSPLSNLSTQTAYGRDVTTDELVSRGGQEYPVLRFQRRRWNLDMQNIRTTSELWQSLDAVMQTAAAGGNVLVVPDITSASVASEALFGRLKQVADVKYPLGSSDRRSWTGQLTERL